MSKVIIQISMSLDGYIAAPDDSDVSPLGNDVDRLHRWMFAGEEPGTGLAGADQAVAPVSTSRSWTPAWQTSCGSTSYPSFSAVASRCSVSSAAHRRNWSS